MTNDIALSQIEESCKWFIEQVQIDADNSSIDADMLLDKDTYMKIAKYVLENAIIFVCERVAMQDMSIRSGNFNKVKGLKYGKPLHSLVVCSELHEIEQEWADIYAKDT